MRKARVCVLGEAVCACAFGVGGGADLGDEDVEHADVGEAGEDHQRDHRICLLVLYVCVCVCVCIISTDIYIYARSTYFCISVILCSYFTYIYIFLHIYKLHINTMLAYTV